MLIVIFKIIRDGFRVFYLFFGIVMINNYDFYDLNNRSLFLYFRELDVKLRFWYVIF